MIYALLRIPIIFISAGKTREIVIGDPANGGFVMGGDHPVVKQSMLTCDTMDTAPNA